MSETPKPFGASLIIKRTVAVTGLIMLAFVAFHLTNNIQIYFGQETYNRDGFAWKTPLVITKVRPVLIVAVTVHVIGAVWVTLLNKRSRPVPYQTYHYQRATLLSRGMIITGLLTGLFIAYHVAHAKIGATHPALHELTDPYGRKDIYTMMITTLRQPLVALIYAVGLTGLFAHLLHGAQSMFTTLGLQRESNEKAMRWLGWGLSAVIYAGYISIPIAIWLGLVG